jgi:hypothetical protein
MYGQEEATKGVSASVICGKVAQMGTGCFDLKMDIPKLLGRGCQEPKSGQEQCKHNSKIRSRPLLEKFIEEKIPEETNIKMSFGKKSGKFKPIEYDEE